MAKTNIGQAGEKQAAKYLKGQGFEIIFTNHRVSGIEIDIIARQENVLCFIEVKTRRSRDFGLPEEFVNREKRKRMISAARIFSQRKKFRHYAIRFDIVSVICQGKNFDINHLENAFEEQDI